MSLTKLVALVHRAPPKTELRITVGGDGTQTIALDVLRRTGRGPLLRAPLVDEFHSHYETTTLDGMADYVIEQLAAKALGIEGYA